MVTGSVQWTSSHGGTSQQYKGQPLKWPISARQTPPLKSAQNMSLCQMQTISATTGLKCIHVVIFEKPRKYQFTPSCKNFLWCGSFSAALVRSSLRLACCCERSFIVLFQPHHRDLLSGKHKPNGLFIKMTGTCPAAGQPAWDPPWSRSRWLLGAEVVSLWLSHQAALPFGCQTQKIWGISLWRKTLGTGPKERQSRGSQPNDVTVRVGPWWSVEQFTGQHCYAWSKVQVEFIAACLLWR